MVFTLFGDASDPSLTELVDYSARVSSLKQSGRSLMAAGDPVSGGPSTWLDDGDIATIDVDLWNIDNGDLEQPASFSPVRDRDLRVLIDWFTHDSIGDIEADIRHYLRQLMPEPCWEDDPFDFLKEYL